VETRKWNHIHSELAEIAVKLTREAEGASGSADSSRDKVVKITVGRGGKLKSSEANIVQGLVIKSEALVGILDKLVHGEGTVVRLYDGIRHLRRRDDRVGRHDTIRVLLTDLRDEQGAETRSRTTSHRVGELEALETVTRLSLLADNIQDRVDELSALGVVALSPVISGSSLAEDEVIRAEKLTKRAGADRVHGSGLKIHQDGSGHIAATSSLVEIHVDAL